MLSQNSKLFCTFFIESFPKRKIKTQQTLKMCWTKRLPKMSNKNRLIRSMLFFDRSRSNSIEKGSTKNKPTWRESHNKVKFKIAHQPVSSRCLIKIFNVLKMFNFYSNDFKNYSQSLFGLTVIIITVTATVTVTNLAYDLKNIVVKIH